MRDRKALQRQFSLMGEALGEHESIRIFCLTIGRGTVPGMKIA